MSLDIRVLNTLATVDQSRALDINLKACDEYQDEILKNLKDDDEFYFYENQLFMGSGGVCFRYCLNGEDKTVFFDHQPEESYLSEYVEKERKSTNLSLKIPIITLVITIILLIVVLAYTPS